MDDVTRQLVQDTWTKVSSDQKHAADIFYSELFKLDPSIQYLFKGDLDQQKQRLMGMFNVAVRGLDKWDELQPMIVELGRRHRDYAVLPEHYVTMEKALLRMVEQSLGEACTPEIQSAWREAYGDWSGAMKQGATKS